MTEHRSHPDQLMARALGVCWHSPTSDRWPCQHVDETDDYGLPVDYLGSTRSIKHIVPLDGAEHVMLECFCHPEITEANQIAALMGLGDVGVRAAKPGELLFQHQAVAPFTRTEIRLEADDDDGRGELT